MSGRVIKAAEQAKLAWGAPGGKEHSAAETAWKYLVPLVFGVLSYRLCRFLSAKTRLVGVDLQKQAKPQLPEGVGLGAGVCFICSIFCISAVFPQYQDSLLICACTISLNLLLGYVDDTMDLNWGCKIMFPWVALSPLMMNYRGSTQMVVPFWGTVTLGWLFYASLLVLSVFFSNAVNILSGINGVEAGQVLVISGFMAADRALFRDDTSEVTCLLALSLAACTGGLFALNRYPARCFVGDTFCYFSGSAVLCLGVLGGCTKTVVLFFLPQLVNFGLSLPQLVGIVPCPRHRLPQLALVAGQERLVPSVAKLAPKPKHPRLQRLVFQLLGRAKLISASAAESPEVSNLTLLNCVLVWTGPISEPALFAILMGIQTAVCSGVILAKLLTSEWL